MANEEEEAAKAIVAAQEQAETVGEKKQQQAAQAKEGKTKERDFTQPAGEAAGEEEGEAGEEDEDEEEGEAGEEDEDEEEGEEDDDKDGAEEDEEEGEHESQEDDLQDAADLPELVGDGESSAKVEEVFKGDGKAWWSGGQQIGGLSSGWFPSDDGPMGVVAVAERVKYKNEGTLNPISSTDLVQLTKVPAPLYHVHTTYVTLPHHIPNYLPTGTEDDDSPHQPGWGLADEVAELADGRRGCQDDHAKPLQGPDGVWLTVR